MKNIEYIKIIVFVPESHADIIRKVLGDAGAGKIGNYSHCTFTIKGTGRFLPLNGAHPSIGAVGKLATVAEERIETICLKKMYKKVIAAMKKVHPYEEVAYDIVPLLGM